MARTVGCARSRYRPVPTVFEYAEEGAWKKIAEFLQESVNDDNSQQSDQDDSDDEKEEEEDEEKQAKVNQALKGTGETLLMCAASGGSEKTVLQLIQHGADVHRVDKEGRSAFAQAAKMENIPIMDILLSHGADVNLIQKRRRTALMTACLNGSQEVVKYLIAHGADVNFCDQEGSSALVIAAKLSFSAIVQMLLDHGADLAIANKAGKTAMDMATSAEVRTILHASTTPLPPDNWLVQSLQGKGMPDHTLRQCFRVLVQQEGFTTAAILPFLPAGAFSFRYLRKAGIAALGTQQVLINVHAQLVKATTATLKPTFLPTASTAVPGPAIITTADVIAATTWLSAPLAGVGLPAERIAQCERILVKQQGFTTAEVLGALPIDKFTCAYLSSVGITGLGLQHALICIKAGLSMVELAQVPRSVYGIFDGAAAVGQGQGRGVKRTRREDAENSDEEEEEDSDQE